MQPNLYVNTLLEWVVDLNTPRLERILWIPPGGDQVVLIRLHKQDAMPVFANRTDLVAAIDAGDCRVLGLDPYASLRQPEDSIPEEHRKRRDQAWKLLEHLLNLPAGDIFQPRKRGQVIASICKQSGCSKRMFYLYLRRYWEGGQCRNALLPRYARCGGKGKPRFGPGIKRGRPNHARQAVGLNPGVNVDEEVADKFRRGIKTFYENAKGPKKITLRAAHQLTLERFFHKGYRFENGVQVPVLPPADELPTFRQFRYLYQKERDPSRAIIAREGERRFNLKSRPVLGDSTHMAFGPGSVFQLDSTTADLNLVSSQDRGRIIGRPTLYLIVDVFSRLIVGFTVSVESPSYLSAALALEHAASDKVAFCAAQGIPITPAEWPCEHLPEMLLADRGELEGPMADNLVNSLRIKLSNTSPYRADLKGIVERRFRTINDTLVHWIPGAVMKKDRERGERDTRLDAVIDLHEFRKVVTLFVLEHNRSLLDAYRLDQFMIADHVHARPTELWAWGTANRSGALHKPDRETLRLNLLPGDEATVTHRGIRFRGLLYTTPRAIEEQWYVRARETGTWRIPVAWDPRNVDEIYLRTPGATRMEACPLIDAEARFKGRWWVEVDNFQTAQQESKEVARSSDQQSTAAFHAQIKDVVESAQEKKAASPHGRQSKRAQLTGIRDNRQNERDHERGAASNAPGHGPQQDPDKIETVIATDDNAYVPPPSPLEMLKQQREQQWSAT